MKQQHVRVGILLLWLSSIICGCIQKPSKSLVSDEASSAIVTQTRHGERRSTSESRISESPALLSAEQQKRELSPNVCVQFFEIALILAQDIHLQNRSLRPSRNLKR